MEKCYWLMKTADLIGIVLFIYIISIIRNFINMYIRTNSSYAFYFYIFSFRDLTLVQESMHHIVHVFLAVTGLQTSLKRVWCNTKNIVIKPTQRIGPVIKSNLFPIVYRIVRKLKYCHPIITIFSIYYDTVFHHIAS